MMRRLAQTAINSNPDQALPAVSFFPCHGAVELTSLAVVIGGEAFGVGVGTAAFVAYIARSTHPAYTATQFALFTSLAAVPRTFINAGVGWLAEAFGWTDFFLLCAVLAVPNAFGQL